LPAAFGFQRQATNSARRFAEPGDDAQQGGFAAAGWAKQAQKLAPANVEINRVKRRNARTETLADIL
jgi:hypothetical protein